MKYSVTKLNSISKLTIYEIFYKSPRNLSSMFWDKILNYQYFFDFIYKKYLPSKIKNWEISKKELSNINYFLKQLKTIKSKINLLQHEQIRPQDLFLSYVIFTKIVWLYNEYYKDSNITITLLKGITYHYNRSLDIKSIFQEVKTKFLSDNNELLQEFLYSSLLENKLLEDNKIYVLKIFWPDEIITALIIWKIIKDNTKNSKVLLNISEANEQFDYTQWWSFIQDEIEFFKDYIDYFVLYRDFGNSIKKLVGYLNEKPDIKLTNLIDISDGTFKEYPFDKWNEVDPIEKFIQDTFDSYYPNKMFGKNTAYGRMFPYKCYWSKCNFCTINSQNNLSFNNNYKYDFFVDKWVEFIKKNEIYSITFWDEAVPPRQIINFAKKIIENKITLLYQFRTRFDKMYTKEVCELLYKSGARYCGIWLESASDRINEDIWNKWEKHISLSDKLRLIHNFDSSGIWFHNYSIMWFPSETKLESIATYNFLVKNINNSHYYTTTPNIFWLMKWSYIYDNLEEFDIKVHKDMINNPLNLNFEFEYTNWEKRDLKLYRVLAEKIHTEQFTPWLNGNENFNSSKDFWDFIDRSNYFYKMKMIYKDNPYIWFKNINKNVLKLEFENILKEKFDLSTWLLITDTSHAEITVYDWINFYECTLPIEYKPFIENYNSSISLQENIENNSIKNTTNFIMILIKNRLLTHKTHG